MHRLLSTSFILLALVVSAAPVAYAQTDPCPIRNGIQGILGNGECHFFNDAGVEVGTPVAPTVTEGTLSDSTAANNASIDAAAEKTAIQANLDASSEFGGVMVWIMTLFAWLVGVAAITLDNAVYYTVVTMGDYVHKLSAVGVSWRILRDIGNIMLIFGFLAVGITTILNVDWYGGGKKMLPMMIVAAVFLNFSLFITEAIVDAGNLFATQFYTQINGGNPAKPTGYSIGSGTLSLGSGQVSDEPISNAIMGRLGLQTLYNPVANKEIFAAGNTWVIGFMGIILFMTTAFVMFSLAFILIARFVALIFLIIVAPIGFAGLAIPGFAARAKQYWTTLFEQTITAPILLLMLYIALAIITDANFLTGLCVPGNTATFGGPNTNTTCTPNAIGWVSGNFPGFASFILSFLVAIAALLLVIVYAKRWSAFGGDWATRMGARLSFGASAWVGTKTVGLGSHYAARAIQTSGIGGSRTGRFLTTTLEKGAKATFDVRNTDLLKKIPFGSSIDMGDAQKGGYRGQRERTIKAHEEYAKSIGEALEERGPTEKDIATVAEEKRKAAEAKTTTETAKEAAEQKVTEQKAELERLKRLQAGQAFPDKETEDKIAVGQQNLATSEKDLATAAENLKKAAEQLTATNKKDAEDIMKANIKAQKEAYAGNIGTQFTKNPIMWTVNLGMYGPGGAQAAKKIIKEKSNKDKALDLFKKMQKEEEGKSKEEAPKTDENVASPKSTT